MCSSQWVSSLVLDRGEKSYQNVIVGRGGVSLPITPNADVERPVAAAISSSEYSSGNDIFSAVFVDANFRGRDHVGDVLSRYGESA
jgi:hypothetical protein